MSWDQSVESSRSQASHSDLLVGMLNLQKEDLSQLLHLEEYCGIIIVSPESCFLYSSFTQPRIYESESVRD